MAIHAGFCGGNSGNRGGLDASVTKTAIDAVIADMVLVAELHGLLARDVLAGKIGRPGDSEDGGEPKRRQQNSSEETETCGEVCAAMKNLGHVGFALECPPHSHRERWPGLFDAIVSNKTFRNAT